MIIFASLKKFRRLWIHLKKTKLTNKQNMADLLTSANAITVRSERNAANTKITEPEKLLIC